MEGVYCFVGLRITGENLNFGLISRVLDLNPTSCTKKGQPAMPGSRRTAVADVWTFEVDADGASLEDLLTRLEDELGGRADSIRRLPAEYNASVWCSYSTDLAQGGFDLSPANLAFLSRMGIPCTVSILSGGEVEGSEEN